MPPATLLLIDDLPPVLEQRKENLERLGYAVVTATSSASALAILEGTSVAAVLVEYKFEGIDAEAVAYHIKGRFPAQPIVLLSAYSAVPERMYWLVDEYVMRSDPFEKLIKVIDGLPHRKNSEAA